MKAQSRAPVLLLPKGTSFEAAAAGLFTGGVSRQPAQSRQLIAVAQAGIDITPLGGLLQPSRQLPLPHVHGPDATQHESQSEAEPETGQPVLA